MLPVDIQLQTKRFVLRRFSQSDIPFVFSASRFPGFCDGMRWSPPESEDQLLEPFHSNIEAWSRGDAYTFTIDFKNSSIPAGRVVIRKGDSGIWDVGFWTHPSYFSQGIMSESVARILSLGFTELCAEEIQAAHATWNLASRRVLEKAGMRFIRHIPHGFKKAGIWVPEDLLGITKTQWQMQTEQGAAANP